MGKGVQRYSPSSRPKSRDLETVAAMFGMGGTRVEVPDLAFGSSGTTKSVRFFVMIG